MLGIGTKSLIKDEQQAQRDYSEAKKIAAKKNKKAAKTLGHIRSDEREHELLLKKLGD